MYARERVMKKREDCEKLEYRAVLREEHAKFYKNVKLKVRVSDELEFRNDLIHIMIQICKNIT